MEYRYNNNEAYSSEKHSPSEEGQKPPFSKHQQYEDGSAPDDPNRLSDPRDAGHSLHRGLAARQVSMIAIGMSNMARSPARGTNRVDSGGAIGTGLIIGTGAALVNAGPASLLISYSVTGLLCYAVMCALGEMATWLPAAGGFAPYATRVCGLFER